MSGGERDDPPCVVHVIAPMPAGGAESVARALAAGRARAGRPTHLVALLDRPEPDAYVEEVRALGAPVHVIRSGEKRYLGEAVHLARVLDDVGADLVHTHSYHADFVGWWAARRGGRPCVATFHGGVGGDLKNRLYEWLDRRLLASLPAVIGVSARTVEHLVQHGCDPERVHLVRNGHDGGEAAGRDAARAALGLDGEDRVIGWVGRMSAEKGPDLFVEALAALGVPDAVAVMIGDGELRSDVIAATGRLRRAGVRLIAPGTRNDARSLHRAFDVLAVSSRSENLPMVLLEAMAAAVPVVAFDVGGIGELVVDGAGWRVPAQDTDALAAALRAALTDRAEAARRAQAGRRVVETSFGIERWIDQVETIYAAVLRGRARGPVGRRKA